MTTDPTTVEDQAPVETPENTETSATVEAAPRPEWAMVLWVGPQPAPAREGSTVVDLTPAAASVDAVIEVLHGTGLTPADLRSRTLFSVSGDAAYRDRVLAVYAALCGFAGRRVDAEVDGEILTLSEFDRALRTAADAGRPAEPVEQAQVGGNRDDLLVADLSSGFTPQALSLVRFARRLRFVAPDHTGLALTQFVAVAAVRGRAGMDRFPMLVSGTEPVELPVSADGTVGTVGLCLHQVRRGAEQLRRSLRGDTRDAVADFIEPSPRQRRLIDAAAKPLEDVLARLGTRSRVIEVPSRENPEQTEETVAWHCPKPGNHTNGDATPSARILATHDGRPGFRCFRCLNENVDALRLVMWARDCSVDEAADWLLAG